MVFPGLLDLLRKENYQNTNGPNYMVFSIDWTCSSGAPKPADHKDMVLSVLKIRFQSLCKENMTSIASMLRSLRLG